MVGRSSPSGHTYGGFAFWIGVLIAATILVVYVIVFLKRRMFGNEPEVGGAWTLRQLEDMRDAGELTADQYAKLREQAVSKIMGSAPRSPVNAASKAPHHAESDDEPDAQEAPR